MDALYAKLYDRYCKLKKRRLPELDEINKEQEEKFMSYVSVAEELIQHLQSEKEELFAKVEDLRTEIKSVRSAKDNTSIEYQKLLFEEKEKYRAVSEENKRLRMLLEEDLCTNENNGNMQADDPKSIKITAGNENCRTTRQSEGALEEGTPLPSLSDERNEIPECCRRTVYALGTDQEHADTMSCFFQVLIEQLWGMKLAIVSKVEGISITAKHMSSGYSFSLTWIDKKGREEVEILYDVLSLGTLDSMAPEWMKEVIKFSMNMLPVFLERVNRVIKLHP